MDNPNKREWSKPTLVQRPMQETQSGVGVHPDGPGDLQS